MHVAAALLAAVLAILIAAMHAGPALALGAPAGAPIRADMRMPTAMGHVDPVPVPAEAHARFRAYRPPAAAEHATPKPAHAPGSTSPGCTGHSSVCQPLLTETLPGLSPPSHSQLASADAGKVALAAPALRRAGPAGDRGRACWRLGRPALQVWRC